MSFFTHDRRITLLTMTTALPAIALCVVLLWVGNYSTLVRVTGSETGSRTVLRR